MEQFREAVWVQLPPFTRERGIDPPFIRVSQFGDGVEGFDSLPPKGFIFKPPFFFYCYLAVVSQLPQGIVGRVALCRDFIFDK